MIIWSFVFFNIEHIEFQGEEPIGTVSVRKNIRIFLHGRNVLSSPGEFVWSQTHFKFEL